jgi:hypothetical protein
VDPAWLKPFKPEAIAPHRVRAKGLPTSFLRSEEELAAMAEAEAAAAQQMQAAQATEAVRNLGGVDETAKAAEMIMQ